MHGDKIGPQSICRFCPERVAPADWNWNEWELKDYKGKGSLLGGFVGLVVPVQETFILPCVLWSARYKIFFSSSYTVSISVSPTPSNLGGGRQSCRDACPWMCVSVIYLLSSEKEFLDSNLRKDSSLLIYAIHSPFYSRILKKTILYSGIKNTYNKIRKTRKLESIHNSILYKRKNVGRKLKCERTNLCPETSIKNAVQEFHNRSLHFFAYVSSPIHPLYFPTSLLFSHISCILLHPSFLISMSPPLFLYCISLYATLPYPYLRLTF